ncbi:hypothetical protein RB195_013220 [Necator americanus]|uniref:Ground-like domain-containing protein n=1 Tax=Necator americanus TaxID=51031 RepID=A0ABR1DVP8_NECAM
MNIVILLCFLHDVIGFFFPPQGQATDSKNCLCGFPCLINVGSCRQCFEMNCPTRLAPSYIPTTSSPYKQQSYSQLSMPYDLRPSGVVSLSRPYRSRGHPIPRAVNLPTFINNWPVPSPSLVQVPPSTTLTENNGLSDVDRLLLLGTAGRKELLHSAEVPQSASPTPSQPSSPAGFTIVSTLPPEPAWTTSATPPEEQNDNPEPIPIPSTRIQTNPELLLGISITPSVEGRTNEPSSTTTAATVDPSDHLFVPDTVVDSVTNVTPLSNIADSDYTSEKYFDFATDALNLEETTTKQNNQGTATITSVVERPPPPVVVETTHIEVYHPQEEFFPESSENSVKTTIPSDFPKDSPREPSEHFSTAAVTSNLVSSSLSPIGENSLFWMNAPLSPPRMNTLDEKFGEGLSGQERANAGLYATAPIRRVRGDPLERSRVFYSKWGSKYRSLRRGSGVVGKHHRREDILLKKNAFAKRLRKARKIKPAVGMTLSEINAKPKPKCNSPVLKNIMRQKMTFSTTVSKQMIYSAATMNYPGRIVNVICSHHSFSYIVVTSPIYCSDEGDNAETLAVV